MRFEACDSYCLFNLSQSERSTVSIGYDDANFLTRKPPYSASDPPRGSVWVCGKQRVILVPFHIRLVNASVETGPAVFCCYYQGHFVSSNNPLGVIDDYLNEPGFSSRLSSKDQRLLRRANRAKVNEPAFSLRNGLLTHNKYVFSSDSPSNFVGAFNYQPGEVIAWFEQREST